MRARNILARIAEKTKSSMVALLAKVRAPMELRRAVNEVQAVPDQP